MCRGIHKGVFSACSSVSLSSCAGCPVFSLVQIMHQNEDRLRLYGCASAVCNCPDKYFGHEPSCTDSFTW